MTFVADHDARVRRKGLLHLNNSLDIVYISNHGVVAHAVRLDREPVRRELLPAGKLRPAQAAAVAGDSGEGGRRRDEGVRLARSGRDAYGQRRPANQLGLSDRQGVPSAPLVDGGEDGLGPRRGGVVALYPQEGEAVGVRLGVGVALKDGGAALPQQGGADAHLRQLRVVVGTEDGGLAADRFDNPASVEVVLDFPSPSRHRPGRLE